MHGHKRIQSILMDAAVDKTQKSVPNFHIDGIFPDIARQQPLISSSTQIKRPTKLFWDFEP